MTSITASAHPHATGVAVYPALLVKIAGFNYLSNLTDVADFSNFKHLMSIGISMVLKLLISTTFSGSIVAKSNDFSFT